MMKKIGVFALLFFSLTSINAQETISNSIIDNQGFSITSLWRGALGMILNYLSFLFFGFFVFWSSCIVRKYCTFI